MMLSRRPLAVTIGSGIAAIALIAGCSSNPGKGPGNGAGQPTVTGPHSPAGALAPTTTTGVPTPDVTSSGTLLTALGAVDPGLVVNSDTAVGNAVRLCAQLRAGSEPVQAVTDSFPGATLSSSQALAVSAAVENSFCPVRASSGPATTGAS